MSNITLPRAVVEEALEALESVLCNPDGKCCIDGSNADRAVVDAALTALRAALAQQDEPKPMSPEQRQRWEELAAMPQQAEPVEQLAELQAMLRAEVDRLIAAGIQPQRKPLTEEPVAWLQPKTVDGHLRPDLGYETCSKDDYGAFPVCRVPPQRKLVPLTEEVAALTAQRDALLEALKKADHFITNGIELGFIRMPDADTPDTAHETPGIVRAAIKAVEDTK